MYFSYICFPNNSGKKLQETWRKEKELVGDKGKGERAKTQAREEDKGQMGKENRSRDADREGAARRGQRERKQTFLYFAFY